MEFWDTFNEECLGRPWLIREPQAGQSTAIPAVEHQFWIESDLPKPAHTMVSKMIAALGWSADQVAVMEASDSMLKALGDLNESRKVLFFGNDFPGTFGNPENWQGHLILKTHALSDLLKDSNLKKQTWQHLKNFGTL